MFKERTTSPPDEIILIFLDLVVLTVLYFSLLYFWIYPDAWSRGMKPREYAVLGFFLILVFNILGMAIWIGSYLHDRRKLHRRVMMARNLYAGQ